MWSLHERANDAEPDDYRPVRFANISIPNHSGADSSAQSNAIDGGTCHRMSYPDAHNMWADNSLAHARPDISMSDGVPDHMWAHDAVTIDKMAHVHVQSDSKPKN